MAKGRVLDQDAVVELREQRESKEAEILLLSNTRLNKQKAGSSTFSNPPTCSKEGEAPGYGAGGCCQFLGRSVK